MTNITTQLLSVTLLAGCVTACYEGVDLEQRLHPAFSIPEGWTLMEAHPGYVSLRTSGASTSGVLPFLKLETVPSRVFLGDDKAARDYILDVDSARAASEFIEIDLPSGGRVYASVSPDSYLTAQLDGAELAESSALAYSASGYVVVMWLSDRADHHINELDTIVTTTNVVQRDWSDF